jgi:hypothetical protein
MMKNDDVYEIEMIVEHQGETGNRKYLAKWKGCTDLTWIHEKDILSKGVIADYWRAEGQRDDDWRFSVILDESHLGGDVKK